MQITGRDNYARLGFKGNPESLEQPGTAANTAAAFWSGHAMNEQTISVLDRAHFDAVSAIVNRHDPNAQQRWRAYELALHVLNGDR